MVEYLKTDQLIRLTSTKLSSALNVGLTLFYSMQREMHCPENSELSFIQRVKEGLTAAIDYVVNDFRNRDEISDLERFIEDEQLRIFKQKYLKQAKIFISFIFIVVGFVLCFHINQEDDSLEKIQAIKTSTFQSSLAYLILLISVTYSVEFTLNIYPFQVFYTAKIGFDYVLTEEEHRVHPYLILIIIHYFICVIVFPTKARTFCATYALGICYYVFCAFLKYDTLFKELPLVLPITLCYIFMATSFSKQRITSLYEELARKAKVVGDMKKVFELFPHGVLIQEKEVFSQQCFVNHEFTDQVHKINNSLVELDRVQVSFSDRDNEEEQVSMTLNQYLHSQRDILKNNEISEQNKVTINAPPSPFESDEESENSSTCSKDKIFSIKSMMVDWEGKPSIMHVFINTTELHQLEEAKNKIRCQKIMFASASHEFRTPLNAIINSYKFIKDLWNKIEKLVSEHKEKLDAKCLTEISQNKTAISKFIRMGHNSSVLLLSLVEDILNLSKIEAGTFEVQKENFVLNDVIREVFDLFQHQCQQKSLRFKAKVDPIFKMIQVESDKKRIKQILLNLLSNAFKFTFKGHIYIKANLAVHEGERMIEIKVEDTGIGIEEDIKPNLFTLFSSLCERGINPNGTGLGLTICKKYLDCLGGTIEIDSLADVGTCVTLQIPFIPQKPCVSLSDSEESVDNLEMHQKQRVYFSSRKVLDQHKSLFESFEEGQEFREDDLNEGDSSRILNNQILAQKCLVSIKARKSK